MKLSERIRNYNDEPCAPDTEWADEVAQLEAKLQERDDALKSSVDIIESMQMYALGDVGEYDERAKQFTDALKESS